MRKLFATLLGEIKHIPIRTCRCWTRLILLPSVITLISHRNNKPQSPINCLLKWTGKYKQLPWHTNPYIDFKGNRISQLTPQQSIVAVNTLSINCTGGVKINTCEHHTGRLQCNLLTSWSISKCCHFWFQCNYSLAWQCVPSTTSYK